MNLYGQDVSAIAPTAIPTRLAPNNKRVAQYHAGKELSGSIG